MSNSDTRRERQQRLRMKQQKKRSKDVKQQFHQGEKLKYKHQLFKEENDSNE